MKRWPRRISPRRAAFGGTICLILGVVMTVGVASIIALRTTADLSRYSAQWNRLDRLNPNSAGLIEIAGEHRSGVFRLDVFVGDYNHEPDQPESAGLVLDHVPRWCRNRILRSPVLDPSQDETRDRIRLLATGWPMLSAWCEPAEVGLVRFGTARGRAAVGGFTVGNEPLRGDMTLRTLPLIPIFPGFLINTLFYAALWFGLFFAVGRTRRFIRTRRGRCPRCGYDLRGEFDDGCSECGWNRAAIGSSADSREQTAEGSVR